MGRHVSKYVRSSLGAFKKSLRFHKQKSKELFIVIIQTNQNMDLRSLIEVANMVIKPEKKSTIDRI